jgi:hypothetical protein
MKPKRHVFRCGCYLLLYPSTYRSVFKCKEHKDWARLMEP